MSQRISIERLLLHAEGLALPVVEGVGERLEAALRERLAGARFAPTERAAAAISIGRIDAPAAVDAAALAGLIADRLVEWLAAPDGKTDGEAR